MKPSAPLASELPSSVPLDTVVHLLPTDCWVSQRYTDAPEDWLNEHVIHLAGEHEIEQIDLDAIRERAVLILISGSLRVGQVYNDNTDGSAGLVILGRMEADNIVVGGQEIYVSGELQVNGCFWGEYNHGDLRVTGKMHAKVFVATDEYHYDEDKTTIAASYFLTDLDEERDAEEFDGDRVLGLFMPEVVSDESEYFADAICSWNEWLMRDTVLAHLSAGRPVLRQDGRAPSRAERLAEALQAVPRHFAPADFSDNTGWQAQLGNFQALMQTACERHPGKDWQDVETRVTGAQHTLSVRPQETSGPQVCILDADGTLRYFAILPIPVRAKGIRAGIKAWLHKQAGDMLCAFSVDKGGKVADLFAPEVSSDALPTFRTLWADLLERTENGEHFHQRFLEAVPPQRLHSWLALPFIGEKHPDYDDAENNNFNYGRFNLSFRLSNPQAQGMKGSVDIGCELPGEDYDLRKYFLRPDALEAPTRTELYYCSSQEGRTDDRYNHLSGLSEVFCYDWERYAELLGWVPVIDKALTWAQERHANEQREAAAVRSQAEARRIRPDNVPFEFLDFYGIRFRLLTRGQADALIGDLQDFDGNAIYDVFGDTWRFPDYEGEYRVFLLAEEDVSVDILALDYSTEAHPELFILGFIFARNLHVAQHISAYDLDNSPALVVLGEARAGLVHLFGSVHYLGSLHCEVLAGTYNHGELIVAGPTRAGLIVSDDMRMRFECFQGVECLVNLSRPDISMHALLGRADGSTFREELCLPSSHCLADILRDDLLDVDNDGSERLNADTWMEALAAGEPLLDPAKRAHLHRPGFPASLRTALDRFSGQLRVLETDDWRIEHDSALTVFQHFEHEGATYRQLAWLAPDYAIQMRAVQRLGIHDITLVFDHLDDEGDPRLSWSSPLDGTQDALQDGVLLRMSAVRHALLRAITTLEVEWA